MKLKKLIIKNIASIESAEIDFDRPPLSDNPIFLITGDTGAGKTTILNAICLALYNKVPSLETIGTAENDSEGIRTDNPRQLVRRGAGQAEIALSFDDCNGRTYIARWSVRRARGKADGKMQKTEREIEDTTEGISYHKDDEIKDIILKSTGLTFDQFTRTTMLAQGQFATFMKAKDADKSDILEKITGTDVYAHIGENIYDSFMAKRETASAIENEIKGQSEHLLTDEEIENAESEIKSRTAAITALISQIATIDSRIQWLMQYALLKKEAETHAEALRLATLTEESEETRRMAAILSAWKETIEIRNTINENSDACKNSSDLRTGLNEAILDCYIPILKGINHLYDRRNEYDKAKAETDNAIKKEARNTQLYAHAPIIEEKAKNAVQQAAKVVNLNKNHETETAEYENSMLSEAKLHDRLTKAQDEYLKAKKESDRLAADTADIDISALTEAVNAAKTILVKLDERRQAVETYIIRKEEHRLALSTLHQAKNDLSETCDKLARAKSQLPEAEKINSDRVQILRARMQLNDHIDQLRQRFADTHECPLCGNHVAEMLPQHELDTALQKAQAEAEKSNSILDDLIRRIASLEAAYSYLSKDTKTKEKDEQNKRKALNMAESKAKSEDPNYNADDTLVKIAEEREEALKLQSDNKTKLEKALERKKAYDMALKTTETVRKSLDTAANALRDRQNTTLSLKAKAEATYMLRQQAQESCDISLSEINSLLGDFAKADIDNCSEIAANISKLAAEYAYLLKRADNLTKEANDTTALIERCNSRLLPIKEHLTDKRVTDSRKLKNIETEIDNFTEKINRLEGQLTAAVSKISSTEKTIAEYFDSTHAYSREELAEISAIGKDSIIIFEDKIKKAAETKSAAQGALHAVRLQIAKHEAIKPEMPDDANIETLTQLRTEAMTERDSHIKEKASLEAAIKTDSDTKNALKSKLELLDRAQKERDRWQILENMFGGAGGRRFRNLAQSYVLRALLAKANHYLTRLNSRYTLDCEDGSLTIYVIDHHQGGCKRNVGLLSGGEGFIVSLALALGLSAISKQKIDVDVLFIDEGFGSLDQDTLDTVITTLNNLHRIGNRRIGVISHVEALKERILTQIQVTHDTPTSSRVEVTGN